MGRSISELALLYLIPFAAYFLVLVLRRVYVLSFDRWTRRMVSLLSLTGLALVLAGMIATGLFADRHEGAYRPAYIENGKLVSGEIQ